MGNEASAPAPQPEQSDMMNLETYRTSGLTRKESKLKPSYGSVLNSPDVPSSSSSPSSASFQSSQSPPAGLFASPSYGPSAFSSSSSSSSSFNNPSSPASLTRKSIAMQAFHIELSLLDLHSTMPATLAGISIRFNVAVARLKSVNGIFREELIQKTLLVPISDPDARVAAYRMAEEKSWDKQSQISSPSSSSAPKAGNSSPSIRSDEKAKQLDQARKRILADAKEAVSSRFSSHMTLADDKKRLEEHLNRAKSGVVWSIEDLLSGPASRPKNGAKDAAVFGRAAAQGESDDEDSDSSSDCDDDPSRAISDNEDSQTKQVVFQDEFLAIDGEAINLHHFSWPKGTDKRILLSDIQSVACLRISKMAGDFTISGPMFLQLFSSLSSNASSSPTPNPKYCVAVEVANSRFPITFITTRPQELEKYVRRRISNSAASSSLPSSGPNAGRKQ